MARPVWNVRHKGKPVTPYEVSLMGGVSVDTVLQRFRQGRRMPELIAKDLRQGKPLAPAVAERRDARMAKLQLLLDAGRTMSDAARMMGEKVINIVMFARNYGIKAKPDAIPLSRAERLQRLEALLKEGKTIAAAAKIMGEPVGAVQPFARRYGLTSDPEAVSQARADGARKRIGTKSGRSQLYDDGVARRKAARAARKGLPASAE